MERRITKYFLFVSDYHNILSSFRVPKIEGESHNLHWDSPQLKVEELQYSWINVLRFLTSHEASFINKVRSWTNIFQWMEKVYFYIGSTSRALATFWGKPPNGISANWKISLLLHDTPEVVVWVPGEVILSLLLPGWSDLPDGVRVPDYLCHHGEVIRHNHHQ